MDCEPKPHLPDMFVRKLLHAELAGVEILPKMDVSVHPHVVGGCIVLSTVNTDVSLLSPRTW